MITLTRLAVSFACALGAAHSVMHAQVVAPASGNGSAVAELAAFLAAQPKWSVSAAVRTSVGYKDNLLLSFSGEERSPFVRGSVDTLLLRLPQDRFDFWFYAQVEGTRYTAGKTVDDDSKVYLQTEPGYRFSDTFKFAVPVTGYYSDQVFDQSDTEVERLVAEVKVTGLMVGPIIHWDFYPSWWFEAQGVAHRKRYDDRSQDGDIGEGNLRVGWKRGSWLNILLSGAQRWRDFDSRAQSNSAGRELPDTELKISEREGEFGIDLKWGETSVWKSSSRVSLLHYRDNGSGFFNFREQKISQELEWTPEPWRLRVRGSAARIDYGVQSVGLGIEPPARLRDEYAGEVHLERKFGPRWMVYGSYTWERSRSNDFVASYIVNEGLLGVRWSWEK